VISERVEARWWGRQPYLPFLERQRQRREAVLNGEASEVFWLLEHDPVVTLGRRAHQAVVDRAALAARGVPCVETERGGLATWHGPGQLVGYLVIDLVGRGGSVRGLVEALEEGILRWLGARGVAGCRRPGAPGVYVGADKVAAIGLHVRRGVTLHGWSLNLDLPSGAFRDLLPCGLTDVGITDLARLGVALPPMSVVAPEVAAAVWASVVDSVSVPGYLQWVSAGWQEGT
jgi:lipoyl(octanoyl) transferase